jgi:diaminopimelate epimerase
VAALEYQGAAGGGVAVRVPGGEVSVEVTETTSFLRGPSVLVARGELSEQWWSAHR